MFEYKEDKILNAQGNAIKLKNEIQITKSEIDSIVDNIKEPDGLDLTKEKFEIKSAMNESLTLVNNVFNSIEKIISVMNTFSINFKNKLSDIVANDEIITEKLNPVYAYDNDRTVLINGIDISEQDFISAVKNFRTDEEYQKMFAQYASTIYNVCKRKKINPILVVAQAMGESNFGAQVPENSPYNYWGLGVYNNKNTGKEFDTFENAVEYYCDTIKKFQTGDLPKAKENSALYSTVNNKFSGNMENVYDVFSAYAYLGDDHKSRMWKGVNAQKFIHDYLPQIQCKHNLNDPTTLEEQSEYIVFYVDNKIIGHGEAVFGEGSLLKRKYENISNSQINDEFFKIEDISKE